MISVIINVYNGEKYIKKCLDSIINQTYKNLEIIIVNDGSTDNTLSICNKYKDKRIKIITTENKGLSNSRNVGIDAAKGDYLYFVDADDFIEKDTLQYLYDLIKKYKVKIATCKALDIKDYNFTKPKETEEIRIINSKDYLKDVLLKRNRAVYTWNKLMHKDLFKKLRFENRIINDMAFTHKIIMKTDSIVCGNLTKYYYLRHNESITAKKASTARWIDIYEVYRDRYYYVQKKYPNMIENNACVMKLIIEIYLKGKKELDNYLMKEKAFKFYNEVFTLKIINCNISIREKIKILLFRINPKLNKLIVNIYLKLKGIAGK